MADEPLIDFGGCLKKALADHFMILIPTNPVRMRCGRCRAHCLVVSISDGIARIEEPYLWGLCSEDRT